MIPSYTRRDLAMNISGSKFYLPFPIDTKEEEVLDKMMKLLTDTPIYERELYTDCVSEPFLSSDRNHVTMKCLYDGHDERYPFSVTWELFRLKDEQKIHDGKWMVAMTFEHVYQGLLDELLEIRTVPKMISALGLTEYSYF